jgi:hypothetical protein
MGHCTIYVHNMQVSVPGRLFRPCLNFERKARAYPSKAPFRHSYLGQAPGLTRIYWTRLERLDMDKHSSLFGLFVSDEENKLYNIDTLAKLQNTFL